jgi:two-component system, NarL family, invasion response regulator UvrY
VRILLIDDHPVVREGYRRLLERTPDMIVIGEAATGEEAYGLFCEHHPDLIVLDVDLPGMSGLETIRRILAREPRARVLVFSMHQEALIGSRALRAGARGYVTKASAPDVLLEAVRAVGSGRLFISNDMAQVLAVHAVEGSHGALNSLSPREFEVFRLLAEGKRLAEIARILSLSEKTVANYQWSVKQKLEADTSAQMALIALERGLVQND